MWRTIEALTRELSQELCEQLRLILEPTLASKLRGDYRTGKRINMKKVRDTHVHTHTDRQREKEREHTLHTVRTEAK